MCQTVCLKCRLIVITFRPDIFIYRLIVLLLRPETNEIISIFRF
jgi:hypothetical protein